MPAPDSIRQLVERFEQHRSAYLAGKYNETQLRREFLDPFFEALGWDVLNKQGNAEEYKHVIHEDSLEIEGVKKAPDYAFKVGRERKFFVEARKPSEKDRLVREVESTDKAIDRLVYELYGLSEEEIRIVEG